MNDLAKTVDQLFTLLSEKKAATLTKTLRPRLFVLMQKICEVLQRGDTFAGNGSMKISANMPSEDIEKKITELRQELQDIKGTKEISKKMRAICVSNLVRELKAYEDMLQPATVVEEK